MITSKVKEILSKRNLLVTSLIVVISIIIGFTYNFLLPDSLTLIYHKVETKKVDDNLLFGSQVSDTSNTDVYSPVIATNDSTSKKKSSDTAAKTHIENNANGKAASLEKLSGQESPEIKTVNLEQMQKIVKLPDFVIIDARNPDQFKLGHIPNSINIFALDTPDNKVPKIYDLPTDKKIIVYCDGGNCDLSHELAKELLNIFGFKQVYIYSGGWEEWTKH